MIYEIELCGMGQQPLFRKSIDSCSTWDAVLMARDMVAGYEMTTGIEFEEVSITSVDEILIPRDELEFVKDIIAIHLIRNDAGEWVQKFSIRDAYSSAMQEILVAKLKATGKLPLWFSLDDGI